MKKTTARATPALWVAFLCFCLPAQAQQDRKFAFLVGIGNYPAESGWQRINAPNDLVVMRDVLVSRGFPAENIRLLRDSAATREGILRAWNDSFLAGLQPGDLVYFQFSGHGQQAADDNGDELDGYDEAIVPYDSPQRFQAGVYEGKNLIRDDELNALFAALRRRLGPKGSLLVVLDACHSGTGTRGFEVARGTDAVMASDEYRKKTAQSTASGKLNQEFVVEAAGTPAPMVVFSGSGPNQLNFETRDEQGRPLGSLTYALGKKLMQATAPTTYRGLFDQIRLEMGAVAPRQQPWAEGSLDQEILGGRLLERPWYFRVKRWNDAGSVVIDAGWAAGLNTGAKLALYPPETRDPARAKPLARGTVREAEAFEAILELDSSLTKETARAAWVYTLEQNFGDLRLGLSIKLPENHPLRAALLEKTATYPLIRLEEPADVFVSASGKNLQLTGPGDLLLESVSSALPAPEAAERFLQRMLAFAQAKYLRRMESESPNLSADLELVPLRLDPSGKSAAPIPLADKRDATGNVHFQNDDVFKVRVTNRGEKTIFFTLLDLSPDNSVSVLVPGEEEPPAEYRLPAGQSMEVPQNWYLQIGPPAGLEMFKLIVTEQPVDLRPVVQRKGAGTRGSDHPLQRLFGQTFFNEEVQHRGGQTQNLASGSVLVKTVTFTID